MSECDDVLSVAIISRFNAFKGTITSRKTNYCFDFDYENMYLNIKIVWLQEQKHGGDMERSSPGRTSGLFSQINSAWQSAGVLALLTIIIAGSILFVWNRIPKDRYSYDEADYKFAVSKGFWSNYLDKNIIPLKDFISYGIRYGRSPEKRSLLSGLIRSGDDIWRHFHGPLYFYYMIIADKIGINNEDSVRRFSFILLYIIAVGLVFMVGRLSGPWGSVGGLFSALCISFSPTLGWSASLLSPHVLYTLFSTVAICLMSLAIKNKNPRLLYPVAVSAGLATLTIEYAPLVVLACVIAAILQRRELFVGFTRNRGAWFIARLCFLYACTILVLWPSALLKLSLVKTYLFFAYFMTVRGSEYGSGSFLSVWSGRITASPIEYAIIAAGLIFGVLWVRRLPWLIPLVAYGILILLTTVRNTSPLPTYITSLCVTGFALGGIMVNTMVAKNRARIAVMCCSIVVAVPVLTTNASLKAAWRKSLEQMDFQRFNTIVEFIGAHGTGTILTYRDFLPTLHYYFPDISFGSYREGLTEIAAMMSQKFYNGIVYEGTELSTLHKMLAAGPFAVECIPVIYDKNQMPVVTYCRLNASPEPDAQMEKPRPGLKEK